MLSTKSVVNVDLLCFCLCDESDFSGGVDDFARVVDDPSWSVGGVAVLAAFTGVVERCGRFWDIFRCFRMFWGCF